MNFFESQDTARRNTKKLIVLFALAVISLIVITNLLVMVLLGFSSSGETGTVAAGFEFNLEVFLLVSALVTGVVLLGSLYRIASLRGGGARIAEMMNGKLLLAGSGDLHERRVLNVVEEMAIASGTPVPPVYLMEEAGINAFAAGYTPSDAVIGVTRGTIETLTREQLQGVIAHEFSHILHGDMRINIRLIGILHGIMVLGIIGYYLMRGGAYSRRSKDSGGIVMLGLGLVVIGFVGTFFGNLIKAAVSRQREFLADASAVQFTRNPDGIAGALMQIANHHERSYLNNPKAAEISHALFEEAGGHSALSSLYATHPPLEKRIGAILPNWDGSYELIERQARKPVEPEPSSQDKVAAQRTRAESLLQATAGVLITDAMINQIGDPGAKHIAYADQILAQMPPLLHAAAQEPSGARAVIYLLVLDKAAAVREQQLQYLQKSADKGVYAELQRLTRAGTDVAAEMRLPLITIALASLRQLSRAQYELFKKNFDTVIAIDKKVNLFEWSLQKIVFHHMEQVFGRMRGPTLGRKDLRQVTEASTLLLSIIAHATPQQGLGAEAAFAKGAAALGLKDALLPLSAINFEKLNGAVDVLADLKPLQKPALLKACAACITADHTIAPVEVELLRAIAATIDCPMPPLVS